VRVSKEKGGQGRYRTRSRLKRRGNDKCLIPRLKNYRSVAIKSHSFIGTSKFYTAPRVRSCALFFILFVCRLCRSPPTLLRTTCRGCTASKCTVPRRPPAPLSTTASLLLLRRPLLQQQDSEAAAAVGAAAAVSTAAAAAAMALVVLVAAVLME